MAARTSLDDFDVRIAPARPTRKPHHVLNNSRIPFTYGELLCIDVLFCLSHVNGFPVVSSG